MNDSAAVSASNLNNNPPKRSISEIIKALGPGVMMATAAVGGSHLVASTQAGAQYGWQLAFIIILVNLFKYPFFLAGVQYTVGTGKSLVEGYRELGVGYLWLFNILNFISSFVNIAALLMFSSSLLSHFLPMALSIQILSVSIILACLFILAAGHYSALSTLSKMIMAVLITTTLMAVVIAATKGSVTTPEYVEPSMWTLSAFGFIVIMMGWMPAPIEISSFTSLWLKSQCRSENVTVRSALFDFNIGYIGTALLAIVFLALGALVLHGSGETLQKNSIAFSNQLINMYTMVIGDWSKYLITIIAFFCIFGSTITCIDGYSRVLTASTLSLTNKRAEDNPARAKAYLNIWMIIVSLLSLAVVFYFQDKLMAMLNFAMILAFMTTPIFAVLNYLLVTRSALPDALKMTFKMKLLAWAGLIYLFSFLIAFIWYKWFYLL